MTPDQTRLAVRQEYESLLSRMGRGEINASTVDMLIEGRARAAARHHGIPGCWQEFMPDTVREDP